VNGRDELCTHAAISTKQAAALEDRDISLDMAAGEDRAGLAWGPPRTGFRPVATALDDVSRTSLLASVDEVLVIVQT